MRSEELKVKLTGFHDSEPQASACAAPQGRMVVPVHWHSRAGSSPRLLAFTNAKIPQASQFEVSLLTFCLLTFSLSHVAAAAGPPLPPLITTETQTAIERGLEYLARTQSRQGAWRHSGRMGQYPVAMTALSGLAFLANGNTTTQGQYAPQVSRAADFILDSADQSTGLIWRLEGESRSMYGHGFSVLFLGQLHGMEDNPEKRERIHRVLQRAVKLTERSQSKDGGWLYTPDSRGDEGSVTITQLQGLRACRNAGVTVPKRVIDRALGYLQKSALPDGGITYRADGRGGPRPPITAAAVACWYNAGVYDHPLVRKNLEFVKRHVGRGGSRSGTRGHYFYAHFYMAQVMWLSGTKEWEWYFPKMRDRLLASQEADGAWMGDHVGPIYGTAIALTILQLPYQYLPIVQR